MVAIKMERFSSNQRKDAWRPMDDRVGFCRFTYVLVLTAILLAIGSFLATAETDDFALSNRAQEALDLYGQRDLADRPFPPSALKDEATSRALQTYSLYLRAAYSLIRKRVEPAREALEEAAKLVPDNYDIRLALASLDGRTPNWQQAVETCDRLIKEYPARLDAYELKGRILEENGRVKEAIAVYTQALERWPNCDPVVGRLLDLTFRRGDLDLTIKICKRRLEREPRHFPTLWMLSYACALKAQANNDIQLYRESVQYYEKALESKPAATKLYQSLSEVYEKLGERDKALATLRRGLVADPSDREIRRAFERLVSPDGDDEKILAAYRALADEYPTSVEILDFYAAQLTAHQKFGEAREQYERLLKIEPNNVRVLLAIGGLDLELGETGQAEKRFERAAEIAGEDVKTYEAIGTFYLHSKLFDQALKFFDKALARDPKRMEIYLALAQTYDQRQEPDKAVEVIQRGLKTIEQPKSQKILLIFLTSLQQQKRLYGEAQATLRKAYELDRTDVNVFFALAELLLTVEEKEAFDSLVTQGRETFRNNRDEFQERLALLLLDFHRYAETIPELSALIERHPDRWQLYAHLATAYQRLRQPANGERLSVEARDHLGGDSTDFHRFAARYYGMRYEHQRAYEALLKLLEATPVPRLKELAGERFTLYGSLIYNLGRMNKTEEVGKLLERAERELGKLDPTEMKMLRARALGEMKRYDEEIALYQELLKDDPDNISLHYELGSALNEAKRNEEAEKVLRQCLEMLPKAPKTAEDRELRSQVLNHLGYMFAEQGINLDEAEHLLTEALELQPRAGHIVDSIGWLHFKKGRTEQALTFLKKALDYSSEDPVLYDHIGDAYAKAGDRVKALENWRAALRLDPTLAEVKAKIEKAAK